MKLFICSVLHFSVTSALLGPKILRSTLFSHTLSMCSSLNVKDQVSHPCNTIRKQNRVKLYIIAVNSS